MICNLTWFCLEEDERKMLCQMLPRLNIPGTIDNEVKLRGLVLLMEDLQEVRNLPSNATSPEAKENVWKQKPNSYFFDCFQQRPLADSVSRNILTKFQAGLRKKFPNQLGALDEEALKEIEGLSPYFDFIKDFAENAVNDESNSEEDDLDLGGADSDEYQVKSSSSKRNTKTPYVTL